jgi:hypothetical protein
VAARKRAFAATVTQPLLAAVGAPSVSQLRFAPRPAQRRLASRPASSPATRSETPVAASAADHSKAPGRISVKWLLLGVAVATTIVFVVIRILASGHAADNAQVAADAGGETTALLAPRDAAPAIAAPAIAAPQETAQNQSAAAGTAVAPPDANTDAKTDASVALKTAAPKVAGRKAAGKVEAATGAPLEPPVPKAESVAAAPRRATEAPRDPWQAMNEGLSRCAREDFLSRFACEQRLRLQYCPNYWGLVPQCAIGRTTDHGQ